MKNRYIYKKHSYRIKLVQKLNKDDKDQRSELCENLSTNLINVYISNSRFFRKNVSTGNLGKRYFANLTGEKYLEVLYINNY